MIDLIQQINSVRRQVGTRVIEAGEARTVTISQTYNASIDELWEFVRLSSEGWSEANIAAGAAEAEAHGARDRTTAAYTAGAPELV